MEEFGFREVADNTGYISNPIESYMRITWEAVGIGCLDVGITEHFILMGILPGVSLVARDKINKFILYTL
jgi:hypothetical protein